MSGKIKTNPKVATGLIFILLFEFVLVVMDPHVEVWSNGQVWIKLAVNSIFALAVFAGHQFFEGRMRRLIIRAE